MRKVPASSVLLYLKKNGIEGMANVDLFIVVPCYNEEEVLRDKGRGSVEIAKSFAEREFEKYRVIQDRLFESDFDKLLASTEEKKDDE